MLLIVFALVQARPCPWREAVELVRAGQSQVRDETARLVNALRSNPKARGRWGEQSLRNVLEQVTLADVVAGKIPRKVLKLTENPDAWKPR